MKINVGIFSLSTIMVLAAYFLRLAMGKMIIVSGKWWKRLLLLSGCWVLLSTVIFIGDPINILLSIFFFSGYHAVHLRRQLLEESGNRDDVFQHRFCIQCFAG